MPASDTDCTDFRSLQTSYAHRQDSCVFCALEAEVGAGGHLE
jgi:hypothetical protein